MILSFVGRFAGTGSITSAQGSVSAFLLMLGVFLGSATWWFTLSSSAATLGARLKSGGLRLLNVLSGAIIAAFGLWQLTKITLLSAPSA